MTATIFSLATRTQIARKTSPNVYHQLPRNSQRVRTIVADSVAIIGFRTKANTTIRSRTGIFDEQEIAERAMASPEKTEHSRT